MLGTVALHGPPSMGFSRQEYWSGLPCPPPGDLPDPENESASIMSLVLAGGFFTSSTTWKALGIAVTTFLSLWKLRVGKVVQYLPLGTWVRSLIF